MYSAKGEHHKYVFGGPFESSDALQTDDNQLFFGALDPLVAQTDPAANNVDVPPLLESSADEASDYSESAHLVSMANSASVFPSGRLISPRLRPR